MPMIYKRIEYFNENKDLENEEQNNNFNKQLELLKTIIVLPKPNYTEAIINHSKIIIAILGNNMLD